MQNNLKRINSQQSIPMLTKVVSVPDGDTIRVVTTEQIRKFLSIVGVIANPTIYVRFFGIDIPAINQPYGKEARGVIAKSLPADEPLVLYPRDIDQYGRMVAEVCIGDLTYSDNLNEYLLSTGLAIAYKRWLMRTDKYNDYCVLEAEAKRKKVNIWTQKVVPTPASYRERGRMRVSQSQVLSGKSAFSDDL